MAEVEVLPLPRGTVCVTPRDLSSHSSRFPWATASLCTRQQRSGALRGL